MKSRMEQSMVPVVDPAFALEVRSLALAASENRAGGYPIMGNAQERLVAQLEQKAQELERSAQATKGRPQARLRIKRIQALSLIERIKAGEAIDPREIDKALQ